MGVTLAGSLEWRRLSLRTFSRRKGGTSLSVLNSNRVPPCKLGNAAGGLDIRSLVRRALAFTLAYTNIFRNLIQNKVVGEIKYISIKTLDQNKVDFNRAANQFTG